MGEQAPRVTAIPPGHVLLHIGLPKSGTTALQTAAAARRRELRRSGVLYPGKGINHRLALSAAMGREATGSSRRARASDWSGLTAEIEDAPQRVLLSYELVCAASVEEAARLVEDLDPERTHVVVTVRAQSSMLPSIWQQYVKTNLRRSFDSWSKAVLGDDPDPDVTPSFWLRHDLGDVCERWASVVGPDRVTVVALDRARPELLAEAFGGLLDVDPALFASGEGGASENRSLTYAEVELVRRVQRLTRRGRLGDRWRSELVMHGMAPALQSRSASPEDRARVPMSAWIDAAATRQAAQAVGRVRDLGVRVVGDLDVHMEPARIIDDDAAMKPPKQVSVEAVAAAVAGVAELALPSGVVRLPEPAAGGPASRVLAELRATRGERWIRRHAGALRGLVEADRAGRPPSSAPRMSQNVAAELVVGVISRTAGRGDRFERPQSHESSPGQAMRWAWVRWRRGHVGRILKGLRPGV